MLEIKKGNKATLEILVKDEDGVTLSNLSTANEVRYMIKTNKTDVNASALVSKTTGAGVTVDSPSTGYITVVISPSDTEGLTTGKKYHGLQIEYSASDIKEIDLSYDDTESDELKIIQDIIRTT